MKHLKFIPALFLFVITFTFQSADAQIITNRCQALPVVGSNCVGACGSPTSISYSSAICPSFKERFCVTTDASSLCPNHDAKAVVYVNGNPVTSGNITAVGSTLTFSAPCGASIKVVVKAYNNGSPIQCVWLGNLDYSLRKA